MDVRNNFLFIDGENCKDVKSRIYGWCIIPSDIGGEQELLERPTLHEELYDGSYVIVQNFTNDIRICQDARGSHGLYLYEKGDYFAIANSFMLLLEKLSESHHALTINKDYMDSFLLNDYTMESCLSTFIKEVQELPRNVDVRIDKNSKQIYLHEKVLMERSIDICSREAVDLIDVWYAKWTDIICKLVDGGADVNADLSGGFDSRITFMLVLGAKVPLEEINIHSYKSRVHTFVEDYEIAKKIVASYGAELDKLEKNWEKIPIKSHDSLAWSFYIRLGFHKQLQFQLSRYKHQVYHFAGLGGETIKHDQYATREEYIDKYRHKQADMRLGYDFMLGFIKTLDRSGSIINKWYPNHAPEEFGQLIYNESGDRHHHGKEMAEIFGSNELRIGPLLDVSFQKICYSSEFPYLLYAVLLQRFEPNLLKFEFNNQHAIPTRTLEEARRINEMFPRSNKIGANTSYRFVANEISLTKGSEEVSRESLWQWCRKIYESGFVKGNLCKLYPARVYEHAKVYYETHGHYPLEEMNAAIAVAYSVHCSEVSRFNNAEDICDLLADKLTIYNSNVEDLMSKWPVPEHRLHPGSRIILYGAGKMGQAFRKQILMRGLGKLVLWVDKVPEGKGEEVSPIYALKQALEYDVLLVAIENRKIQREVIDSLRAMNLPGFDEDKIILG